MKGVFELQGHRDLMAKLERDLVVLTENPRDSDAVFNFYVTAWHLLEWVYPGNKNHEKRRTIRRSSNQLRICEHIAVGAKHFEPTSQKHDSIERTYRDNRLANQLITAGHIQAGITLDRLMIDRERARTEPTATTVYRRATKQWLGQRHHTHPHP